MYNFATGGFSIRGGLKKIKKINFKLFLQALC